MLLTLEMRVYLRTLLGQNKRIGPLVHVTFGFNGQVCLEFRGWNLSVFDRVSVSGCGFRALDFGCGV